MGYRGFGLGLSGACPEDMGPSVLLPGEWPCLCPLLICTLESCIYQSIPVNTHLLSWPLGALWSLSPHVFALCLLLSSSGQVSTMPAMMPPCTPLQELLPPPRPALFGSSMLGESIRGSNLLILPSATLSLWEVS